MTNYKKSKYSRDDRKHIAESIENLKNDEDYVAIFEILMDDESNSYTENSNGVFLNLSTVSDTTLDRISKYLNKINTQKNKHIEVDTDIIPTLINNKNERTYKLSNYEKNIIKQRNLRKAVDDDVDYEEFRFSNKKNIKSVKPNKLIETINTNRTNNTDNKSTKSKKQTETKKSLRTNKIVKQPINKSKKNIREEY
ncbi:hypothetical protein [Acanthamoeba castellanii mimivirus]|uniref:Uncharacterized protein R378 n=5 Tax=Mimivirus TaxID=315393 RepID=YR378_MIMIV|nr:hypothetical protein MIMI_gp0409 [Acanthamoeba polyphaga mimivirus]Q5UQV9.1 RecName: Full=Uncharacterized protein R378 [Acanthamoeba polyphaga mimivirus]AEQ60567.1 hypothetical protein [Acanthamoeba castellanii mamavirus]AHA45485.1 hypothetical protein HIRU_S579 [Hirudovirus strain Sangsue]ALR83958.1 hypothetical protein [Niemeyer virus]AMK61881.1 hypothetical protein [Samba virus]AMZ02823.1 hypothetical protein [Mimivirus Bombay]EJN40819.1 hypothetical protein lvs_R315 [Acanthamoeba poly